jgi:branched-chain amino acid transport system permease protein
MIVVGGMGSVWGPLVGAAILMVADEGFKEFQDWRALGMGLILPLFVVLLPGGLTGLFGRGRSKSADPKKMRANSTCSRGHANTAP